MIERDSIDEIRERIEGIRDRRAAEGACRAAKIRLNDLAWKCSRAARVDAGDRPDPEDLEDALDRLAQAVHDQYDLTGAQRADLRRAIGVLRGSIAGSATSAVAEA